MLQKVIVIYSYKSFQLIVFFFVLLDKLQFFSAVNIKDA